MIFLNTLKSFLTIDMFVGFLDELDPSCFSDSIFDSGFSYINPEKDWKGSCSSGRLQSPIDIPRTGFNILLLLTW